MMFGLAILAFLMLLGLTIAILEIATHRAKEEPKHQLYVLRCNNKLVRRQLSHDGIYVSPDAHNSKYLLYVRGSSQVIGLSTNEEIEETIDTYRSCGFEVFDCGTNVSLFISCITYQ